MSWLPSRLRSDWSPLAAEYLFQTGQLRFQHFPAKWAGKIHLHQFKIANQAAAYHPPDTILLVPGSITGEKQRLLIRALKRGQGGVFRRNGGRRQGRRQ